MAEALLRGTQVCVKTDRRNEFFEICINATVRMPSFLPSSFLLSFPLSLPPSLNCYVMGMVLGTWDQKLPLDVHSPKGTEALNPPSLYNVEIAH